MKIIFLDIDGVLNCETDRVPKECHDLSKRCIENLNELIENTKAKVVISSTWRLGTDRFHLQNLLEKFGFKGDIIDFTPRLRMKGVLRGNEILLWMKDNEKIIGVPYNEYNNYVILDDDSDMLYWQKDNFILIDSYCGITRNTVYRATKILNK